ncbi:MAG: EamA family transporter [Clostridia bacterium]|nr:EamA family transporter [Clostridia bacterium]
MTDVLFTLLLILLYTLQSVLCKLFSNHYPGREDLSSPIYTIVSGISVALITFAVSGFQFSAQPMTLLLVVVNALALITFNTSLIKASAEGPFSAVIVFQVAGGVIIPTFVTTVFFGTPITPVKILGIIVLIASVYLISRKPGESFKNKKKYFLFCFLLAIANGVYGSLTEIQQRLTGEAESQEMVILSYALAAVISMGILWKQEKKDVFSAFKQNKKSLLLLIACCAVVATAINAYVMILPLISNKAVLYSFDNSGVFMLSTLFSFIFFKEKLTKANLLGCLVLCAALACISLF